MRKLTVALVLIALLAASACGDSGPGEPEGTPTPLPTLPLVAPTPPPEDIVTYQGAPYAIARILGRDYIDGSLLAPAGEITTAAGEDVEAFACPPGPPAMCPAWPWEAVTDGEVTWNVWEPLAVQSARRDLALSLQLPQYNIEITGVESVDWSDACLGLTKPDEACVEVITPGFLMLLTDTSTATSYEYHTDLDGGQVRQAEGAASRPSPAPGGPKVNRDAAIAAAVAELARLAGVDASAIVVIDAEERQWPDACLGLAREGEICAQVITPGFLVTLEVGGKRYEARTDVAGYSVRLPQSE